MTRMILSLEDQDKVWLEREAAQRGISMAEVVRLSLRSMQNRKDDSFDKALKKTSGIWRAGDGLKYQRKIRQEWR